MHWVPSANPRTEPLPEGVLAFVKTCWTAISAELERAYCMKLVAFADFWDTNNTVVPSFANPATTNCYIRARELHV